MARNTHRQTAGILLFTFAVAALVVGILALALRRGEGDFTWVDYPTALGDAALYTRLGGNDLHEPNLRMEGVEEGLYRRSEEPLHFEDALMELVGESTGGDFRIYRPAGQADGLYLKAGDDLYHAFGEREHWPPYRPPSSP